MDDIRKTKVEKAQTRAAFAPNTINAEARTVDVVWSVGAPVQRSTMFGEDFLEILSMERDHVDLGRLNNGAPVLNSHARFDLGDVIGVVEEASIENGEGKATLRFSERDEVETIFKDIKSGIIRNISVGYFVRKYLVEETDGVEIRTATDWEPFEISLVSVGADSAASVRSNETQAVECELVLANKDDIDALTDKERGISEMKAKQKVKAVSAEEVRTAEASEEAVVSETAAEESEEGNDEASEVEAPAEANDEESESEESADEEGRSAPKAVTRSTKETLEIMSLVEKGGFTAAKGREFIEQGTSVEDVRKLTIDKLAKKDEGNNVNNQNSQAHVTMDGDKLRAAVTNAIQNRANPKVELTDAGQEFRGMTLIELARHFVPNNGARMSKTQIAERALHSTSDFALILSDFVNKSLRDAYNEAPQTFQPITRAVNATDFKNINRLQLGEAPKFEKVLEHGEYKRGTISEGGETYSLSTYGKVIGITRQVIINDDLNAFSRIPVLFGRQARNLESDLAWSEIVDNRVMDTDNTALFHADHNNNFTGAGSVLISTDLSSLSAARKALRNQLGLDGETRLSLQETYLIVPPSLQTEAEKILGIIQSTKAGDVNPFQASMTLIVEPRLEDGANGATTWYVTADPTQIDMLEMAHLDGVDGPTMATRTGFDVDGIEIKASMDVAARAIDYRGFVRSVGV